MGDEDSDEMKRKKKGGNSKYNYSFGDTYPGVVIGHKSCNPFTKDGYMVPPHMGWLWTETEFYNPNAGGRFIPPFYGRGGRGGMRGGPGGHGHGRGGHGGPGADEGDGAGGVRGAGGRGGAARGRGAFSAPPRKPRRGWSPGVIGKSVAKLMTFKVQKPQQQAQAEAAKKSIVPKKKKRKTRAGAEGGGDSEPDEPLQAKPTLRVQRKGDVFTISVSPLKDLTEIQPNEDPYVDCDPIVFKITKKRSPEERAKVEARKLVKLKKQRDAEIRKALAEAVEDICKCAYMDVFCNDLSAIDNVIDSCPAFKEPGCICEKESLSSLSSNATWDIEYTPPFGCFDLQTPRKRKNFIHVETQYIPADAGIEERPVRCKKSVGSFKPKSASKKTCCRPECL